jgi:hypothetical protein
MRRTMIMGVLAGLALASPAAAQWGPPQNGWVNTPGWNASWGGGGPGWNNQGWNNGGWNNQGGWNGNGQWCRRSDGTTGTVLGAAVGGVIGNQVVKGNDRTVATVAGAVVGGLLGRSIDRGRVVCR